LQAQQANFDKFKKPEEKPKPEQVSVKRLLLNSIFSKIKGREPVTKEDITKLTAKVCDFIDLSGVTLPEVIFGICLVDHSADAVMNAKIAYTMKLENIVSQIHAEFNGRSSCEGKHTPHH
jgi:hypothetical protein